MAVSPSDFVGLDDRLVVKTVSMRAKNFTWLPDEASDNCLKCNAPFTLLFRRHHVSHEWDFVIGDLMEVYALPSVCANYPEIP